MTPSKFKTTDSTPIFVPICADIARARAEVRRATRNCTPEKCVCHEARRELMLRVSALRSIRDVPLGDRLPGDEDFLRRNRLQHYRVALDVIRRDRRDLAQQRERMRARGLSEQQIAANPPRTRRQKARDKQRALYINYCIYCGRDPWEHRKRWPQCAES